MLLAMALSNDGGPGRRGGPGGPDGLGLGFDGEIFWYFLNGFFFITTGIIGLVGAHKKSKSM